MHNTVIDIAEIKNQTAIKAGENNRFNIFLKSIANNIIDEKVIQLNSIVSEQIDCMQCANCCKTLHPAVTHAEAKILASEIKTEATVFTNSFLITDEIENINHFKKSPCIFLDDNRCTCYEKRPASCADYPHLNKPNFKYRMRSVMENYAMCPIVFNVVEILKYELNFKPETN